MTHTGALQGQAEAGPGTRAKPGRKLAGGLWRRFTAFLGALNQKLTYVIGLPAVVLLANVMIGHFQFMSDYQNKVVTEGSRQVSAAESTFTDVSTTFARALTLQQQLFFNFRDAIARKTDGDDRALETKDARAIYKEYDQVRMYLQQNIDLLAHRVEANIDWPSDVERDSAAQAIGGDPMSRLALGAYNFDCDGDMPSFTKNASLKPPPDMLKANPQAPALTVDWQSAKHHVLALYYCFYLTNNNIEAAREWASNSSINAPIKDKFLRRIDAIGEQIDNDAVRLNAFMTLAVNAIEVIRAKFRPRVWYCEVPILRQMIDAYSKKCTPIRTAQNGAAS